MKNVRYQLAKLRLWVGVLALALVSVAHAMPKPRPGSDWLIDTDGESWIHRNDINKEWRTNGGQLTVRPGGGAISTATAKARFSTAAVQDAVIVSKGAITGQKVWSTVKALSGGPLGLAVLLAPSVLEWMTTENTRPNPNPSLEFPAEIKEAGFCDVGPCYEYKPDSFSDGNWYPTRVMACQSAGNYWVSNVMNQQDYVGPASTRFNGSSCVTDVYVRWNGAVSTDHASTGIGRREIPPQPGVWLPASMDDIAPYMSPRPATPELIDHILDSGGKLTVVPTSTTGPPSVIDPPEVVSTPIPQRDQTSTTVASGNPNNLVDGAPARQIGTSTGTNQEFVNGEPVIIPTHTETTARYDSVTDKTTTTTTTTQDPHTVTKTNTPSTTLTYTPEKVTSNTTKTTVTNITNNITNVTNTETTTKTDPKDNKPQEEQKDPCEDNPDRIGCMKTGEIPAAEKLIDTPFDLTVTPAVFAGGGACPSPLTFIVAAHSYAFSYQPICDKLVYLKALFLMMAAVMAAYILADSFKV